MPNPLNKNISSYVFSFLMTAVVASLAPSSGAANGDVSGDAAIASGKLIVEKNCSQCHAIGAELKSNHADAPAFKTLSQKYPVRNLEEALVEGIYSGHEDMPVFEFTPYEAESLIRYLESIQETK